MLFMIFKWNEQSVTCSGIKIKLEIDERFAVLSGTIKTYTIVYLVQGTRVLFQTSVCMYLLM